MRQLAFHLAAPQHAVKDLFRDEWGSSSSNMADFDNDNEHTFDAWFSSYIDPFNKGAGKLDGATKVRLLLGKLSPPNHERYNSYILPKLVR